MTFNSTLQAVPAELRAALLALIDRETKATGARRRRCFRVTRCLIAGALGNGFSASETAAALSVTAGSVRARGCEDGVIDVGEAAVLLGVDVQAMRMLEGSGVLPRARADALGNRGYLGSDVVRALLSYAA